MEKGAIFSNADDLQTGCAVCAEAGYNTNRIRKEKLIGEAMLQKIRSGQMPSWATLETICSLLDCQPGDLIAFSREEAAK